MELKNTKKAIDKIKELDSIDSQIRGAEAMITACEDGCSILFRECDDGTGAFDIGSVYEDGGYPKEMYTNIAKCVYNEFNLHRDKIIAEIETL